MLAANSYAFSLPKKSLFYENFVCFLHFLCLLWQQVKLKILYLTS